MSGKNIFLTMVAAVLACTLFSCDSSRVYDEMQDLDSSAWNDKKELQFQVTIKDASVPYILYYSVRYDNSYPYHNLYINRVMEDSSGKIMHKKLQWMDLFNAETGVPNGSGMGSNKDYLILSEPAFKFPYAGTYTFKLKQYMRQENIPGISAVGFRVEKAQKN